MPRIVVDVMPKSEILDPQGKAVAGALLRTGHSSIAGVRIGKRFELEINGEVTDAVLAEVREIAEETLANTVIEEVVSVRVAEEVAA
ncbi:phosphoribosylformylglycinamidine synthase subunit PurS [Humidisolicoccus flavus]|uniref:phosphoribosylformylglycinamidine synthase subunit PurS n=1 Tax=Humidisolicoccus flavus TaxID=3111414 RepID=UPI003252286C